MHSICSKRFHPICGRRNGLRMEWVENEGLQAFCDKHGKKKKRQPRTTNVDARLSDSYQDDDVV